MSCVVDLGFQAAVLRTIYTEHAAENGSPSKVAGGCCHAVVAVAAYAAAASLPPKRHAAQRAVLAVWHKQHQYVEVRTTANASTDNFTTLWSQKAIKHCLISHGMKIYACQMWIVLQARGRALQTAFSC